MDRAGVYSGELLGSLTSFLLVYVEGACTCVNFWLDETGGNLSVVWNYGFNIYYVRIECDYDNVYRYPDRK